MNKRQAKKAFKKKYGMNPGEAAKILNKLDINKIVQQIAEAFNKIAQQIAEAFNKIAQQTAEILQQHKEERNNTTVTIIEMKEGEELKEGKSSAGSFKRNH